MPKVGQIAISKNGHDSGRIYVVVGVLNEEFCLVCDGEYRKLEKPKQKRYKHLRVIQMSESLDKCINEHSVSDEIIKSTLKQFL